MQVFPSYGFKTLRLIHILFRTSHVMFFHLPELDCEMTSEASRSAREAFCSPSAAIT